MPASWKCSQCGLVNFASDQTCKRCGALVQGSAVPPPAAPVGIVLEDGYVMPPPPGPPPVVTGGTWREGSTLVMSKDASLPDHCVKCDAPANVRLKRNLSWHHPALFLLLLLAWLIYLILAMALRKRATVYLGLCQQHYERRRNSLIAGFITLAVSLALVFGAIASEYPLVALLGLFGILASAIWLAFIARVVNVKKIDDRFVWLTGIDKNYLARFPPLPQ